MRIILSLTVLLLLAGCAFSPEYLYYGNTSWAYYNHVKKQSENSLERYQNELDRVIGYSAKYGLKIPPGLYADYALIMLQQDEFARAKRYLDLEREQWADSQKMVEFLIQKYGLRD